jgi:S1-C subfamily serine protease
MLVIAGVVAALLVCAAVVVGIMVVKRGNSDNEGTGVPEGPLTFVSTTQTRERDHAVADAVALVVPGIYIKYNDGSWSERRFGHGSGFVVTSEGHIITNRHVVEKLVNFKGSQKLRDLENDIRGSVQAKIWVFFGQEHKLEADLENVYVSQDYDLAILKVNQKTPRFFALSKTEASHIPMLDSVSSLGFPSTDQDATKILNPNQPVSNTALNSPVQRGFLDADFNVTKENGGIKKNSFRARPKASQLEAFYLVHTARIAPGNSGGPLIARDGTVLGINTLGITISMGDEKFIQEGQNYALTLPQLRKEIDKQIPNVTWRDAPE